MSTELVEVPATNPMAILARAVESGVKASELKDLMDLAERHERNMAAAAYNAAVTKFQGLCPVVQKVRKAEGRGGFTGYQYASFDDVMQAARPHLEACGLSISFSFEPVERGLRTLCKVSHGSHHEDHWITVPIPSDMKVNDTQKWGAACKYAMRYALCGALNIVVSDDVDDDAQGQYEPISEAECRALEQLLVETNSDFAKFCKAYNIGRVSELPQAQLTQARAQLNRKVEQARAHR